MTLHETVAKICEYLTFNNKQKIIQELPKLAFEKYNIPLSETADLISLRKPIESYSLPQLYYFLMTANEFEDKHLQTDYNSFFTTTQIKKFKNYPNLLKKATVTLPLVFKDVVKIRENQFITKITASELVALNNYINYNENTQRTLKHIIKGDVEYYQIFLNKSAVSAIRKSFENNEYIPNTITINMPLETDYEYEDHELIINELDRLDLIDGYHRYVALSQIIALKPNWNYEMELRITNFSEADCRYFIYQEDQKTKMSKINSDSYNKYNYGNICANRLNKDTEFLFYEEVNNSNGKINQAEFSEIINKLWFNKNKVSNAELFKITNKIRDGINKYCNKGIISIDNNIDYKTLFLTLLCIKDKKELNKDILNIDIPISHLMRKDVDKTRKEVVSYV